MVITKRGKARYFRKRIGGRKKSRVHIRPIVFIAFIALALATGTLGIFLNIRLEDRLTAWLASHPQAGHTTVPQHQP